MAVNAIFGKNLALFGAKKLRAPICKPIEAKLLKPQRAYVDITIDLS
jgi:hypothetical protein